MNSASRRQVLQWAAAGAAMSALGPNGAFAQGAPWPTRAVSLLVGYPPGGGTDASARFISNRMSKLLGQPVVVDNKPGAGGNLAANEVMRATDGYKLLVANSSITINPHTLAGTSPDPTKLTPIGLITETQLVLCVNSAAPVKNFEEFKAWVKAESSKGFSYATAGAGGNTHVAMEYFRERASLPKMTTVPYRGSAPAIQDVVGNQVPCILDAVPLLLPFIGTGKLRPILVAGNVRHPALPDVPTAAELGVKDFVVISFVGLWGPPNLSPEVVQKTNAAMNGALADPEVRNAITTSGNQIGGGDPERLAMLTRNDFKLWGEVARRNNIRAE